MLYFYCKVLIFQNVLSSLTNHIPVSWNCDIYQHTCSLFIIAYYNVWLVTGDGPVSLFVGSTVCLPYLLNLFLLILVHTHTSFVIIIIIIVVVGGGGDSSNSSSSLMADESNFTSIYS
jgi:hypothetical protein